MLQNIREKLQGWVAFAVLLIIGVPLALSFVSSDFAVTSSGGFAARVNGEEISSVDFQRVYQNELVAAQERAAGALPPEAEQQLKREALDRLTLNRAVTQFVRDAGFRVSAARVIDYIRGLPDFQVGGQFSKPAYDATLQANGISPVVYERDRQSDLAIRQLTEGLVESSFFTPNEFRRLIALDQERRDVAFAVLDPRVLGAAMVVSDADVQAFYATNPKLFQSPETVTLEYVEVDLKAMARDYTPDEEALRKAYESDPTRFRTAEERRASHILIAVDAQRTDAAAKALADDIAGKLAAGADFTALAAEYSNDPGSAKRGGDLGFAAPGNYVEAFDKALFALQVGETSPPVKTEFGYHIIRLDELRQGAEQSFEAVRAQLTDELRKQKAQDEFFALAERLDDLALENPTSLEPVAKDTGLKVERYAGFGRAGGGPLGNKPNLISAVFAPGVLEGSENTPLIELDESRAVVARVAEHKEPAPLPLEQVRADIIDRIRAVRAATEAGAKGEQIVQRVQAGEDLAAVAAAQGLSITEAGPLTRLSPAVPSDLLSAIFRAPKPEGKPVVQGTRLAGGAYAVFQIRSVVPGEPERIPQQQRDETKKALAQRAAAGETEALAAHLRETAEVVVAPDLFKAEDEQAL